MYVQRLQSRYIKNDRNVYGLSSITYKYYTNTSSERGKILAYKIWLVNKGNKIYEDEKTELSNNKSHEQSQ